MNDEIERATHRRRVEGRLFGPEARKIGCHALGGGGGGSCRVRRAVHGERGRR